MARELVRKKYQAKAVRKGRLMVIETGRKKSKGRSPG